MTKARSSFLRQSLIYGIGDLLSKGARILLVPYYIAELSPSEVGSLALATAAATFSWNALSLGSGFVLRRFYYEVDEGDQLASSLWLARLCVSLLLATLLVGPMLVVNHFAGELLTPAMVTIAAYSGALRGNSNVVEGWLNIRLDAMRFRAYTTAQFVSTTLLIVLLVSFLGAGVQGALLGELLSYAIFTVVSGVLLGRSSRPRVRETPWREVVRYGLPFVPYSVMLWGVASLDRLLLANRGISDDRIAVYEVSYLLASGLSIVVRAMRQAWLPLFFRNRIDDKAEYNGNAVSTMFVAVTALGMGLYMLFAPELVALFGRARPGAYADGARLIQILAVGFAAQAVFLGTNQSLLFDGRLRTLVRITALGLAMNVVVNLVLIGRYGISGSAWSTVAAFYVMAYGAMRASPNLMAFGGRFGAFSVAYATAVASIVFALPSSTSVALVVGKIAVLMGLVALGLGVRRVVLIGRRGGV